MVTEKYVPYKGVFGNSAVIETTLNWFNNSSELCFLWVYPDGKSDFKTMGAATRAGKVVVSGNRVKISALTNGETTSESVFVYRASSVKTQAYQVSEGVIPLSSIINELEELRRFSEDVKAEVAKSIRVPEWDGETHFTDKDSRAGKVMGFDKDGNPTTGEDCEQVKDLFEAGKAAQESASNAAAQAQEAKRQADIAGTHASDCNDSVAECSDLLKESELEANKAKTYYEKTASVGADSVNKATVAANRAVEAKDAAVVAKDTVLAAKEDVASKTQELDKAVCYVACAASEVEGRVETAKQELEQKAEQTKQEIAGFTDVYKKSETYSKSEIDGVDTGAELTLKMNEIHEQLKDYEAVTGVKLPWELWEAVMAEFQRWQANPSEVKEWVATSATDSTNPYSTTPLIKPVVDFSVTKAKGGSFGGILYASFKSSCRKTIYFSNATDVSLMLTSNQEASCDVIVPNATNVYRLIQNAQKFEGAVYCPKATNWNNFAQGAFLFNRPVASQNGTSFYMAFYEARKYNQVTDMRSASSAKLAFYGSAMSAENISATLDSLPTWTDGASHVITFTGSPGAAELTQESPSVAAAIAKGWTVEL